LEGGVTFVCADTIAIDATSAMVVAAVCRPNREFRIRIVIGQPFHAARGGEW
jgi:hypothetical protein